jgi:hypothetical protein
MAENLEEGVGMEVVRQPRDELVRVANLLDEAVAKYLRSYSRVTPDWRWEAPFEAFALSALCVRNVEAAAVLARTDEVLAPAAWANARNAFETATRVVWLLYPGDRFECEMRWIALLREYEGFHDRMARAEGEDIDTAAQHLRVASELRGFRTDVEARVPTGYSVPPRVPNLRDMLTEMDGSAMYRTYIEGSQVLHGTMAGTEHYRRNLGTERAFGDFTAIGHWILPLRLCWLSLKNAARFVVDRLSGGSDALDWSSTDAELDAALRTLALTVEHDGSD